jgi:hypothetical protein
VLSKSVGGLQDLAATLAQLDVALQPTSLQAVADAAANALCTHVRAYVPQRTGHLLQALQTAPLPPANGAARACVQIADSQPGGIHHDAIYVEYGTGHSAPEPFMRLGYAAGAPDAIDAATQTLKAKL